MESKLFIEIIGIIGLVTLGAFGVSMIISLVKFNNELFGSFESTISDPIANPPPSEASLEYAHGFEDGKFKLQFNSQKESLENLKSTQIDLFESVANYYSELLKNYEVSKSVSVESNVKETPIRHIPVDVIRYVVIYRFSELVTRWDEETLREIVAMLDEMDWGDDRKKIVK